MIFSIFLVKLFAVFGVLSLHSSLPGGRLSLVSPGCCSLLSPHMALLHPSLHPCGSFGVTSAAVPEFSAVLFFFSSPRTIQPLIQNIQWSSIQIVSAAEQTLHKQQLYFRRSGKLCLVGCERHSSILLLGWQEKEIITQQSQQVFWDNKSNIAHWSE